jgi:plasmid stabilization system protein ParE
LKREEFILTRLPVSFMKSIYRILWSDEALKNLKALVNYLENNWTEKELNQFVVLLDKRLDLIQQNLHLFPPLNPTSSLRRSVLSKQTSIYYRIVNNELQIITLFDNRQNPEKLKNK